MFVLNANEHFFVTHMYNKCLLPLGNSGQLQEPRLLWYQLRELSHHPVTEEKVQYTNDRHNINFFHALQESTLFCCSFKSEPEKCCACFYCSYVEPFDIYYRMIRKFPLLMPKESGLLTLTRVFQKPKLFTHRVGGEKSYCQMKEKCMVSVGSQT